MLIKLDVSIPKHLETCLVPFVPDVLRFVEVDERAEEDEEEEEDLESPGVYEDVVWGAGYFV